MLRDCSGLYLDHNLFEGDIPATFKGLSKLVGLYCNNNRLTGAIPDVIGADGWSCVDCNL